MIIEKSDNIFPNPTNIPIVLGLRVQYQVLGFVNQGKVEGSTLDCITISLKAQPIFKVLKVFQ